MYYVCLSCKNAAHVSIYYIGLFHFPCLMNTFDFHHYKFLFRIEWNSLLYCVVFNMNINMNKIKSNHVHTVIVISINCIKY